MEIRTRPEDFLVDELYSVPAREDAGDFAYYRLSKRKLTTPQAVRFVAQHLGVAQKDVAYVGLKDKQAATTQLISVRKPRKAPPLRRGDLKLAYLGRGPRAVHSDDVTGNRFRVTARGLKLTEARAGEKAAQIVRRSGLPNYFDDQRFGALRHGQGWVFLDVARGRFERALQRLTARPSHRDYSSDADAKAAIKRHWGDWGRCARLAKGSSVEGAMRAMSRSGGDFIEGLKGVPLRTRLMHTHTFQSHIWNRSVVRWMQRFLAPESGAQADRWLTLESRSGPLPLWRELPPPLQRRLEEIDIPLIDAATEIPDRQVAAAVNAALRDLKLRREQLACDALAGFVLKHQPRPLMLRPGKLRLDEPKPDKENRGRHAVRVHFSLPKGAYASLVVHRLFPATRRPGDGA